MLLAVEEWASHRGAVIRSPRSGLPVRYAIGRLVKRQPLRHFLIARKTAVEFAGLSCGQSVPDVAEAVCK
jgi:hypothetical protein